MTITEVVKTLEKTPHRKATLKIDGESPYQFGLVKNGDGDWMFMDFDNLGRPQGGGLSSHLYISSKALKSNKWKIEKIVIAEPQQEYGVFEPSLPKIQDQETKILKIGDILAEDRKRLFLENDNAIRPEQHEIIIDECTDLEKNKTWDDIFHKTICGAKFCEKEELIQAIIEHDDIFVFTNWIGSSYDLLYTMTKFCVKNKIEGKRLFNFADNGRMIVSMFDSALIRALKTASKTNEFYQPTRQWGEFQLISF